jgi:polysaccharide biosynthesis protein PslH
MQILFITDYLPYPLISGDRIRVYQLLKKLSRHHEITLLSLVRPADSLEVLSHLKSFCTRIETGMIRRQSKLKHLPGLIQLGLSGKPLALKFIYSPELAWKVKEITHQTQFDIIQIEHSRMAIYREAIAKNQKAKQILMFHNIGFEQYNTIYKVNVTLEDKLRLWLHSRQMRGWEPDYAAKFDCCITVSENDRQILLKANPKLRVGVIDNGVDTLNLQPISEVPPRPALLFVGSMGYSPVVDASIFFYKQILPLVRQRYPEIDLWLVGREPDPEVLALADDHVHVTGQVESVLEYYRKTTISIVPLRAGGGTRLKILESMALGRPVVTTTIGCEGLEVVPGKHCLVADTPQEFAQKIFDLLEDETLATTMIEAARKNVVERYDWEKLAVGLEAIYQNVISKTN